VIRLGSVKLLRRHDVALLAALLLASLVLSAFPSEWRQGLGDGVVRICFAPLELPAFQLRSLRSSWRENESLRDQLAAARLTAIRLTEARLENDRLRSLLSLRERGAWTVVTAQVSGREPALLTPDLRIDRGSDDGLRPGMIVFAPDGVVGAVTAVQGGSATVRTVFDPQSRVSAIDLRSRVLGVFRTAGGTHCILDRVPLRSDVRVGDTIVSSGYGQLFPFGLPLGTVSGVTTRKSSLTCLIDVSPALDINRLTHLFVITGGDHGRPASLEPAAVPGVPPVPPRRRRAEPPAALRISVPATRVELPETLQMLPERGE
jgi:rod shape-determining protein MreC